LVASDQPLAAAEIGSQLNISARMVRSSLGPAADWLENKDILLKQVRGQGVSLVGPETSKRNLAEAIRAYDKPLRWLSPSERVNVVLLTLCFSDQPTQVKQLQEALNLSRTTALGVLDASEKWLHAYRLQLVRRPNYGCMIIGDELSLREAAIALLQESAGDTRLLALLQGLKTVVNVPSRMRTGLDETLSIFWMKLDIPRIRQLMFPLEQEFAGTLSDHGYIGLCLYLAATIYRVQIGKTLSTLPDPSKYPVLTSRVSEAGKIATTLYQRLGIQLPTAEIDWLALKIAEASSVLAPAGQSRRQPEVGVDPTIRKIVERIVVQASLSLHPGLSTDRELIRYLTMDIKHFIDLQPLRRGQPRPSPLLREVRTQFQYIYSVAQQSSAFLIEELGIELDECEIGNIAACLIAALEHLRRSDQPKKRVLVVCSEGAVTAWLLVSRLRAEFPDIEVAEVISALELENRKVSDGIDVIVSTIPLNVKNIPSRQVNPLLGVEDCRKLKELLRQKRSIPSADRMLNRRKLHLADLITRDMIDLGVPANDWREVVWKAGSRLLQAGRIEGQFIRDMEEIILKHGPYMVIWPGAVLLHAPTNGVRQLGMEIMTLRKPICFGHAENDPVQLVVVLAASDNHSHFTALQELNQLMQNPEARSAIGSTQHKSVILHWIAQYSNSTEM
jgi:transcriptional antiterminator/mannitol/fructose-specific phosphotransferase system IIA component (Ntr-type)